MLVKLDSSRMGKIGYNFDNGIRLSVIFDSMTYSDNYDLMPEKQKEQGFVNSKTMEIWQTEGNPAFGKWLNRKFCDYRGDDPIGYVDVKHLPAILKRADSKVYRLEELKGGKD